MIFGSENISAFSKSNMSIWMLLALQAGLLNMGGLLACGAFVSHVTGYVTMASLELETGKQAHALGLVAMLIAFFLGSVVSGILVDLRLKQHKKPKYFLVFGFLFFLTLLTTVGGFNDLFGDFNTTLADSRSYALPLLLCFTCGVQNGTITLVSRSVVRTTHLTGIITDLGIGLVRTWNRSGLATEGLANLMRAGIIGAFLAGSLIGVPVFKNMQYRGFIFPCLISGGLFAVTLYFQVFRQQKSY
jgi:uncharacterized membrane protein YoaK (UPF0700 family)